jgi:hypothetical protein
LAQNEAAALAVAATVAAASLQSSTLKLKRLTEVEESNKKASIELQKEEKRAETATKQAERAHSELKKAESAEAKVRMELSALELASQQASFKEHQREKTAREDEYKKDRGLYRSLEKEEQKAILKTRGRQAQKDDQDEKRNYVMGRHNEMMTRGGNSGGGTHEVYREIQRGDIASFHRNNREGGQFRDDGSLQHDQHSDNSGGGGHSDGYGGGGGGQQQQQQYNHNSSSNGNFGSL